ncbi:MAG: hypothetical protein ACUVRV_10795 [Cyanobacteriota bacterium]
MPGYHSGNLLADLNPTDAEHPLHQLGSRLLTGVSSYLEQLIPRLPPAHPWRERSQGWFQVQDLWAVAMQSQGHQIPHVHPSVRLSGVYDLQVSESVGGDPANPSGWLEFGVYPERFPFVASLQHSLSLVCILSLYP